MRFAYLLRCLAIFSVLFAAVAPDAWAQPTEPRPSRRGRKYRVKIDSAPQQAAIYLDDEKYGVVGYTPWKGRLQKGQWTVILKKDGYELGRRVIEVKRRRRTQETFVPLKRIQIGTLDVRADGDPNTVGAEVWVDGQLQGQLPVIVSLKGGRHLVEIKKKDYDTFQQWVDVQAAGRVTINPVLKMNAVGTLLVEADVPGAEVYIDGNKHGDNAPTVITGLAAGPHIVEVRKEPAMPWKQTIQVEANKTVKVSAELKASMGGGGGTVRVLSNVDKASVFLDGKDVGTAPIDITKVKPGEHYIEVRAKGYTKREERVMVQMGSAVTLKLDLVKLAETSVGKINIVSPTPEAEVYIDGAKIGLAPQLKEVKAGEHFVVVSKRGFTPLEQKVIVKAGETLTITAKLRAVGGIRFLTNPNGATVVLDGVEIGTTPMVNEEIGVGEHQVFFRMKGFVDKNLSVSVVGGKTELVNVEMVLRGRSVGDIQQEQRGQTSFGARTLRREKVNIDMSMGYPYFFAGGFHIGAGRFNDNKIGLDASLLVRSYFSRTEIGLRGRFNFVDKNPFSFGAFAEVGGGGTLFDDSNRNTFYFRPGVLASITGLGRVTITGRAYLDIYSDRHCPEPDASGSFGEFTAPDMCSDYQAFQADPATSGLSQAEFNRINTLLDGGSPFDRDSGVRFMTSLIIEIALYQTWNAWLLLEGAPFQSERAAFTDLFAPVLLEDDPITYVRLGTTYKF